MPLKSLFSISDDRGLTIKDPLLPATAIGNVATDFKGAVVAGGGGGGGGGVLPPPEFFLQADTSDINNTNPQNPFFIRKPHALLVMCNTVNDTAAKLWDNL